MAQELPTLSPAGWLGEPNEMLPKLMGHIFVSERSQSNQFYSEITSINEIIANTPNDIQEITRVLGEKLPIYFERYFDSATVDVRDTTVGDASRRTLDIDVVVTRDGKSYSLGASVRQDSSRSTRYMIETLNQ